MKTPTIITSLLLISFLSSASVINCHTPRWTKSFKIEKDGLTFFQEKDSSQRAIASINRIRTRLSENGFTKILKFEGSKHTIHIGNKKKFSQLEDYIQVKTSEGHEITYPLTCSLN